MKTILVVILLLAVSIMFAHDSYAQVNAPVKGKIFPETQQVPYNAYVNSKYGFSITPPPNWGILENMTLSDNSSAIVGFVVNHPNVNYTANFLIRHVNIQQSDIQTLHQMSDEQVLSTMMASFLGKAVSTTVLIDKGIQAYQDGYVLEFVYVKPQVVSGVYIPLYRVTVAFILDNGNSYWVNFSATKNDFEKYVADFKNSVNTFYVGNIEQLPPPQNNSTTNQNQSVLTPPQNNPSVNQSQITLPSTFTPTSSKGGGCLIATAAFGSELSPQVQQLRETRDNVLLQTKSGTAFMTAFNQFYYMFSPTIADWERQNPVFKETVKITITPLITTLSILNYLNIDSEAKMLVYGIGVILLNIGIYFVGPAFAIVKLRKM